MKTKEITLNTATEVLVFLEANQQIPFSKMIDIVKAFAPESVLISFFSDGECNEKECKKQLLSWIEINIHNLDNPKEIYPAEIFFLNK